MQGRRGHRKARWLIGFTGSFTVLMAGMLLFLQTDSAEARFGFGLNTTWKPSRVSVQIVPGETETIPVSFSSKRPLRRIQLHVSQDLADYVAVEPSSFHRVRRGEEADVDIFINVPSNVEPGAIHGEVSFVRVFDFGWWRFVFPVWFAQSLPIEIEIAGTVSGSDGNVEFAVPQEWELRQDDTAQANLFSPESLESITAGDLVTPPNAVVTIVDSTTANLEAFVQQFEEGWFSQYEQTEERTVDGYPAILVDDSGAAIPKRPVLAALIKVGDSIAIVTVHSEIDAQEFDDMFNSIEIQ